jgi:two-component system, NtrC family, nitrogen regulation sensor histidine kinase NtrY
MAQQMSPAEIRRRRREKITVVILTLVIVVFTAIEVHLLKTSAQLPFVNSIFFFGLMNLNLILIMLLLFLVFRNAVKLILDERRRKAASRLKTRLVFCFILFAIIPTVLLFTISAFYIKSSFDKWFNAKMEGTLRRSIEVVKNYYEGTETNASHFARKIALTLASEPKGEVPRYLQEARLEYGLDGVEYYADPFSARVATAQPDRAKYIPPVPLETLKRIFAGNNECRIQNVGGGELIRCGVFLGVGKGAIFASYFLPLGLASRLADITLTYEDYKSHNPLNYPIKSTYFAILLMVTLLILFTATWTGFYVARRLTVPIEELARGTDEVARGNLDYQIPPSGNDELFQLIESFNRMTQDLKQSKQAIEEARTHLEVLLASVQSGVVSLDENGRIAMLNQAAAKLLRRGPEELVGKPYWALIPENHRAEFREILLAVYGTAKNVRRELRIHTGDGWLTILVTLSALRDEGKRQMGVVAVFDDVTDIQKMERMLAWREVAKRIAHEIKNPLTPIQLSVQRLRRRYLDKIEDDGTFDEATQIILTEVDSLKTLVSEFSSFARLPEIQQKPESLNEITLEAVNLYRAAHERIRFELLLAEGLPSLQLDRSQLKRVLINLFDNAVDAMQETGRIEVATNWDREKGVIRLAVADEGCGIDEAVYSQLFEPYFSTKQGGTGLGLAIVQRIVNDHGGFVRVTANRPRGTRFTLEFPETLRVDPGHRPLARAAEKGSERAL